MMSSGGVFQLEAEGYFNIRKTEGRVILFIHMYSEKVKTPAKLALGLRPISSNGFGKHVGLTIKLVDILTVAGVLTLV